MIVSHYLSEPVALPPRQGRVSPLPGSELFTRLNAWWRVIRRVVRFGIFRTARQPFKRLDFYTLRHPLVDRLVPYSVTDPKVNMWQGFTWETLRYWNDLMGGENLETSRDVVLSPS